MKIDTVPLIAPDVSDFQTAELGNPAAYAFDSQVRYALKF